MTLRRLAAACLTIALTGCNGSVPSMGGSPPGGGPPGGGSTPTPLTPALQFSMTEGGLDHGFVSTRFTLSALRDLWVRALVPSINATAQLDIMFFNPRTELINETHVAYSSDPTVTQMPMPGMDHPLTLFPAKPVPGGWALDYPVPVAGTAFTRLAVVNEGTWTVEAKVNSLGSPITTTFEMVIGP
jgi:hypothetical protein